MTMPFSALAGTLEALEPVTGRTQMITMLADLLGQAAPDEIAELVYLSQGRLLPDFIQEEFGMNERLIFRSVAQAFKSSNEEVLARFKEMGDAGLVAQAFAQQWRSQALPVETSDDGISLTDVYSRLMQITKAVGSGSQ